MVAHSDIHPRLIHYPHHQDYMNMRMVVQPYVQFLHEPLYRTKSVNTDKFGFREQYDADGKFIDLERVKTTYSQCNVILGGSTTFGVDATSDRETLSASLNSPGCPCINLGVRGAMGRQELINFHIFRRFLPKVKNVVLFSGINNCSAVALEGTFRFPHLGSLFSEELIIDHIWADWQDLVVRNVDRLVLPRYRFSIDVKKKIDRWFSTSGLFRRFLNYRYAKKPMPETRLTLPRTSFAERYDLMISHFELDMEAWAALGRQLNCRVHYVLQPAMTWMAKKLTAIEQACFDADVARVASTKLYTTQEFYNRYKHDIATVCKKVGIPFLDANEWIDNRHDTNEWFTDVCHLTDAGNKYVAQKLVSAVGEWA